MITTQFLFTFTLCSCFQVAFRTRIVEHILASFSALHGRAPKVWLHTWWDWVVVRVRSMREGCFIHFTWCS
ncbi:hypothetical protein DEU56DRAFT_841477 [Suillus clintonianus]|uniref:uncharacterized protein n=1 Tax=Suillus clintonianus TaxID=1904413 RepID=UPI001B85B9CE|nr:uncharacterized protein DEU56DRAFT_841477 [Suillus clintonianus]KAG2115006.1 hypothetical protein DEU56DRAFT_841477 [Suillus clintonianus]